MKKRIIILLIVIGVIGAAGLFTAYVLQHVSEPHPRYKNGKMVLDTAAGEVLTDDLYKKKIDELPKNGAAFASTEQYYMSFYPEDQGFIITLLDSDVASAQTAAEAAFLSTLGISKDQACTLKVRMNVPYSVNPVFSGRNIPFTFCKK